MKEFILVMAIFGLLSCGDSEKSLNDILNDSKLKGEVWQNPFSSKERVAHFDSLINRASGQTETNYYLLSKATSLLEAGQFLEAIQAVQPLLKDSSNVEVLKVLSIANLRMGEIQNCVDGHYAESCIMPLKGLGIHQKQEWSETAIKLFKKILVKQPNDLQTKWLLNIAHMTLGQYPQGVDPDFLITGLDLSSGTAVRPFVDIAGQIGVAVNNMAGGSILDDFNNDGYLDIVTSAWGLTESMHYFINDGLGGFKDASKSSGLDKVTGGLNMVQADYNNDGLLDILVLRGAWFGPYGDQPNSLLKNNGDGKFTDVTIESGMLSSHPTQTATWADFNNDGWLDVFIGNESVTEAAVSHPCELYINNHNGTFTERAEEAGVRIMAFVKGVTSGDFDQDGLIDIYVSTMNGQDILFKNQLSGNNLSFKDVANQVGLTDKTPTFATWFFDFNNDGWLDIVTCNYDFKASLSVYVAAWYEKLKLKDEGVIHVYQNNQGRFVNVTNDIGTDMPVFAMGANFGDIDNDGYPDMMFGTGNPNFESLIPNRLFRNIDGKKFDDITVPARVGHLQKGHAISFADIDNDGDQDIYAEMGGAYPGDTYHNSLYLNNNSDNHWISLRLIGETVNRSAIGTKIKLSFTEGDKKRVVYKWVNAGGSFGANPLRAEIGVGLATRIDEAVISWPNGKTQSFNNLDVNRFYQLTEGKKMTSIQLNKISWNIAEPLCLE